MRVAMVVIDGVQNAMVEVVAPSRQPASHVADDAGGCVEDLTQVVAKRGDDGVEIDAVEDGGNHGDDVREAGFQENFGGDVLDEEGDAVHGGSDTGIEVEEREDLGVEVYFGCEVGDEDGDLADGERGVEEDVW